MENNKFEKRMEFLKKSYERIPSSFAPDEVLRKIDEETKKTRNEAHSVGKNKTLRHTMTVWGVGIASVFVFGIITAMFILEQKEGTGEITGANMQHGSDEYIESPEKMKEFDEYSVALNKEYEIEREKRREMLKLEEKKFGKLEFVNRADGQMSIVRNSKYRGSIMSLANGKKVLEQIFEDAKSYLKLPSEMVQDIKRYPLVDDEQASIDFLGIYRSKVKSLLTVYNEVLEESGYTGDSSAIQAEAMMRSSNRFPKELQNIIDTMQEHSIEFYTNSNMGEIETRYYDSSVHKELQKYIHPNTLAYADMIVKEPYTFGGALQYPVHELVPMLQEMERTLLTVENDFVLYPIMESYYTMIFNNIMEDAKSSKVFSDQGMVNEEYREPLRELASGGGRSLKYIMQPIIEELEASGWRQSKSWDALVYNDLIEALALARAGGL